VSTSTVATLVCAGGRIDATLSASGAVLDLGREQRLFNHRQRIALAIRDGGCLWPGCERPPSWTEAHHIDHWAHGGTTDLDQGVLLCRHHHLRLHNDHWTIRLRAGRYWLHPPGSGQSPGSGKPPTLLVTKSRAVREHLARHGHAPSRAVGNPSNRVGAPT
jgi:hypothetical protein